MASYDCIVIGLGGVGSSALYQAALRGWHVLGLDQYPPGHDRGSSHGRTRITRIAYFEHPLYVPLAQRSRAMWHELAADTGRELFHRTGLLQIGPAGGNVISGLEASARDHNLDVEMLAPPVVRQRYPVAVIGDDEVGIYEASAGYLRVEACVTTQIRAAQQMGADVRTGEAVTHWKRLDGGGFEVATRNAAWQGERLIVAAGAWSSQLLADLGLALQVRRKTQLWFGVERQRQNELAGMPVFFFETASGCFYAFPWDAKMGMKIAKHSGGEVVDDPGALDRELSPSDLQTVRDFVGSRLGGIAKDLLNYSVCMYTMTPSEHFILDTHPQHSGMSFAAGMSGHGFKFVPVLGQYLVELVEGERRDEMEFLSLHSHQLGLGR